MSNEAWRDLGIGQRLTIAIGCAGILLLLWFVGDQIGRERFNVSPPPDERQAWMATQHQEPCARAARARANGSMDFPSEELCAQARGSFAAENALMLAERQIFWTRLEFAALMATLIATAIAAVAAAIASRSAQLSVRISERELEESHRPRFQINLSAIDITPGPAQYATLSIINTGQYATISYGKCQMIAAKQSDIPIPAPNNLKGEARYLVVGEHSLANWQALEKTLSFSLPLTQERIDNLGPRENNEVICLYGLVHYCDALDVRREWGFCMFVQHNADHIRTVRIGAPFEFDRLRTTASEEE